MNRFINEYVHILNIEVNLVTNLREKKKKQLKEKIVEISKDVFLEKGYIESTMQEIAQKAEIGVGTLYNYFPSKAEIFFYAMSQEFDLKVDSYKEFEQDLENDIVKTVVEYVMKPIKKMKLMNKRIMKELFSVVFGNMKSDKFLFKGMMKLDFRYIDQLEKLLNKIKEKEMLPKSFPSHDAAYVIYSVFATQLMMFVFMDDYSYEMLLECIENQIRFVFEGKCSEIIK